LACTPRHSRHACAKEERRRKMRDAAVRLNFHLEAKPTRVVKVLTTTLRSRLQAKHNPYNDDARVNVGHYCLDRTIPLLFPSTSANPFPTPPACNSLLPPGLRSAAQRYYNCAKARTHITPKYRAAYTPTTACHYC
jgi:hypothetical protein